MGPVLIFDKSMLESLNPDEAMWLDNFFLSNITPLFFIETLADLEKEVRKGRDPEDIVGSLAYKAPDMGSRPKVHHSALLAAELSGSFHVDMRYGRPIISGGQTLELEGKTGVIFHPSPEERAFVRWQKKEFLELERSQAKEWRRALSNLDLREMYELFRPFFPLGKPRTLADVKRFVDFHVDGPDQERVLIFGLTLLGIPTQSQELIVRRWKNSGKRSVREFAPYFAHVFSVEMFFCLGIAADVIGRERASHKIDLAYLYYLPFCMVFTSNDNLHVSIAPLFLRENQSFVHGRELKADLAKLDKHYEALPDDVKKRGVMSFAHYPPKDDSFLTARLWDKHMSPKWREQEPIPAPPPDSDLGKQLVETIDRFAQEGRPVAQGMPHDFDKTDHLVIQRQIYPKKGKWMRLPPEVLKQQNNGKREREDREPT